jgi:hypothetical protein
MKKLILLFFISLSGNFVLFAQNKMIVHQNDEVIYESFVSAKEDIHFLNNIAFFNNTDEIVELPVTAIDSITFVYELPGGDLNTVYIQYDGATATVTNPFANQGIQVVVNQSNVSVTATSGMQDIHYHVSGTTTDGSLTIQSDLPILLTLDNAAITSATTPAIRITSNITATVNITGNNVLSDGSSNTKNAVLLSNGALLFAGEGYLNLSGYAKHTISSDKAITVDSGNINVLTAETDGFHSEGFVMNGGSLDISAKGDGIDAGSGVVEINGGNLKIVSATADSKGVKCDEAITFNGGTLDMTVSGAQSKGLSSKKSIVFNDGDFNFVVSGASVLEALPVGSDPSHCIAIKSDEDIVVNKGTFQIECKNTASGGKGFSAGGNIVINDGTITVSTAGNGAIYTNESNKADSYTSCCIKADGNLSLLGGTITCSSTGSGGKGISADGTLTIGQSDAPNDRLILTVSTSGERFTVSGSTGGGGGGWPPGGGNNADYANPKAIKSIGNLTVNSGTITVNCTQTGEGGEGIESKATLTINGGNINVRSFDDCINATTNITINGGTTYCVSTGNDGIDSNGTLTINGGFTLSNGTRSPEEGFDCDNNQFKITGGIIVGTGGATSNPTANVCTQRTIKYTGTAGNAICIKSNTTGEIILLFQLPTYTGTGGGGPGGGSSSSMVVLFTDPKLTNGTYTLQYGGTIVGGTTVNGYNTGGAYSGGSTKNFTITSMLTTVQ